MRRLLAVAVACLWIDAALAQPPSLESSVIRISKHSAMSVGARAALRVEVALPADAAQPVLLTTGSEGTALEVVRGRFVRQDADNPQTPTLLFAVPVVARTAGTAIFRVHVLYYRCATTCVAVEQDAESLIEIAPAP